MDVASVQQIFIQLHEKKSAILILIGHSPELQQVVLWLATVIVGLLLSL
jgi:hypothetical protein